MNTVSLPAIATSRIPARRLCRAQRRPSLAGIKQPFPAFLVRRGVAQLAKIKRTDAVGKAIGAANGKAGIDRANELLTTLNAAARAMLRARERHQATGKWRLDGPGIEPMRDSLAIYEEVLRASSPMQMELAQTVRMAKLRAQAGIKIPPKNA